MKQVTEVPLFNSLNMPQPVNAPPGARPLTAILLNYQPFLVVEHDPQVPVFGGELLMVALMTSQSVLSLPPDIDAHWLASVVLPVGGGSNYSSQEMPLHVYHLRQTKGDRG